MIFSYMPFAIYFAPTHVGVAYVQYFHPWVCIYRVHEKSDLISLMYERWAKRP